MECGKERVGLRGSASDDGSVRDGGRGSCTMEPMIDAKPVPVGVTWLRVVVSLVEVDGCRNLARLMQGVGSDGYDGSLLSFTHLDRGR